MVQHRVHKTDQDKLTPTSAQARLLERAVLLCRHVYTATRGERREAWQKCGVSVTSSQQTGELPGRKEAMPEYSKVHSQVVPDVVLRVDRVFQAFFQRIREGQIPGYPPAIPACMAAAATTASPLGNLRMGDGVTTACWSSPRLGGLPCAGLAP